MKSMSKTEKDMRRAYTVFDRMSYPSILVFASHYRGGPIISVGIGSSDCLPAGQLVYRARQLDPTLDVRAGTPQEYPISTIPHNSLVLLHSNSGKTASVVSLAKRLKEEGIEAIGITARHDSPIADELPNVYFHNTPFEKATAATYSVYAATLFNDAFVHAVTKTNFPLTDSATLDSLVNTIRTNFETPIDENTKDKVVHARQISFMAMHTGLGRELELKAQEIAGKSARYLAGESLLHGYFEGMRRGDVIIVTQPDSLPLYHPDVLTKLREKAAAKKVTLISVGHGQTFDMHIETAILQSWEAYCILPRLWRLFLDVGKKTKGDVDGHSRSTTKYVH